MIRATNSRVLAFDNVSRISDWMSDALCRLATDGGFSTRELYSNDEEVIFAATRPIILTGIDNFVYRHDLLDRSIIVHLPTVSDSKRRPEDEINREFDESLPYIFGALCDAVAGAVANLPHTHLDTSPRMADFAKLVVAAEPALGWPSGTFLDSYEQSRSSTIESALEGDLVAVALRRFLDERFVQLDKEVILWSGSATELLEILKEHAVEDARRTKSWPKTPTSLSSKLRRVAPLLRQVKIDVQFGRSRGARLIDIRKIAEEEDSVHEVEKMAEHESRSAEQSQLDEFKEFSKDV
ncbi:MAG: hypothetical protein ACYC0L_08230 [Thermoleophilia bacterium]